MAANSKLAVASHIVAVLASKRDEFVSSHYIAGSVNTNPVVIRRILSALTRAGIVNTEQGKAGGARLAKCPDKITVWDLAVALGEEHLFAIHKNPANPKCPISRKMKVALGKVFAGAEKAAQQQLKGVNVQELLEAAG